METGNTRMEKPAQPLAAPLTSGRGEYSLLCPRCKSGHLRVENTKDHQSRVEPGVILRYRYRVCTNQKCRHSPVPTQERIAVRESAPPTA